MAFPSPTTWTRGCNELRTLRKIRGRVVNVLRRSRFNPDTYPTAPTMDFALEAYGCHTVSRAAHTDNKRP